MNWLRVFLVGGLTSYRALFAWLNPWILVPTMIVYPLAQLVFYAYLGRAAHAETDSYFVIGDAFIAAALAAVFGTSQGVAGERRTQTLGVLLSSPASRLALFLGRALPTMANGFAVAAFCLAASTVLLNFHPSASAVPGISIAIIASTLSCAALGIWIGAIGLRGRSTTALNNVALVIMLLLTGANVPTSRFPGWVQPITSALPLTHGIKAARAILAGATIGHEAGTLATELAVGIAYTTIGALMLKLFELQSRHTGSLETF